MLIKCPECGKEVSDKAPQCIHCGFPLEKNNTSNNAKSTSIMPDSVTVAIPNGLSAPNNNNSSKIMLYDFVLKSYAPHTKNKIIREVKLITETELEEAKTLVESVPITIAHQISKGDCKCLKARFNELSASVDVVPSDNQNSKKNSIEYIKKLRIYMSNRPNHNTQHKNIIVNEKSIDNKSNVSDSKKKKSKIIAIISIILSCILIGCVVTYLNKQNTEQAYTHAVEMLKSDKEDEFDKALEQLSLLANKKGDEILEACTQYIYELCDKKEYDKAIDDLYNFSSSHLISDRKNLENYINYQRAESLLNEGNVIEAYNQFVDLGEYKDSSKRVDAVFDENKDVFYDNAVSQYDSGNYDNAYYVFSKLGDYEDAETYTAKIDICETIPGTYKRKTGKILVIDRNHVLLYNRLPTTRYLNHDVIVTEINGKVCLYDEYDNFAWYLKEDEVVHCYVYISLRQPYLHGHLATP